MQDLALKVERLVKKIDSLEKKIEELEQNKKWFTVKDLSNYLSISESKIRHMVSDDEIPYRKLDSCVRFNRKKIDLWLDYNCDKLSFSKRDQSKLKTL